MKSSTASVYGTFAPFRRAKFDDNRFNMWPLASVARKTLKIWVIIAIDVCFIHCVAVCPNWNQALIQIRLNTTQLNRNVYDFNHINYHLGPIWRKLCKFQRKIHRNFWDIKFKKLILNTSVSNTMNIHCSRVTFQQDNVPAHRARETACSFYPETRRISFHHWRGRPIPLADLNPVYYMKLGKWSSDVCSMYSTWIRSATSTTWSRLVWWNWKIGVTSVRTGHYLPSSAIVACSTACLRSWKWRPFSVQTVTEYFFLLSDLSFELLA